MRIDKLKFLKGYKCINENTIIDFSGTDNYCALVGLNGSGKSSVLDYLFTSFVNCDYERYPLFKKVIIGDNDNSFQDIYSKLPKFVIFNYSGDSRYGTNVHIKDVKTLQLDYKVWYIASLILQIINDPIIDRYNLKNIEIEKWKIIANELYRTKQNKGFYILKYIFDEMLGIRKTNIDEKTFQQVGQKGFMRAIMDTYINNALDTASVYHKRLNNDHILTYVNKILSTNIYTNLHSLSEGQKKLLVLKLIMYLADEDSLVLLDEPDANLDIQKKRELFEMIRSCKGQVIITTHDPIMTKWMKGHLIFMKDGKQIDSDIVNAINDISEGEVSYQETLLMFQKKYVVVVEGKSDIACIEKAINSNGLTSEFEPVFFLAQNSASSTKATFDNLLSKMFVNNNSIRKMLFLFDSDDAGYKGKTQLEKIKEEYKGKDISHKIDYLFYRPCYNSTDDNAFNNDVKDYFYLEGYFPVDCYPDNNGETINRITHKELYDILDENSANKYLNFNEIIRLKFFSEIINKNGLKSYFANKTDKIDKKYFLGFRPLLDKILEKLDLKK